MPRIPPELRYYLNTLFLLDDLRTLPAVDLSRRNHLPMDTSAFYLLSPLPFGFPVNRYISSTSVSITEYFRTTFTLPQLIMSAAAGSAPSEDSEDAAGAEDVAGQRTAADTRAKRLHS
jgi:hypothetical protein